MLPWLRSGALALAFLVSCGTLRETVEMVVSGDSKQLRDRPESAAQSSPGRPALLVIALDGVDRNLLYEMLEAGELPNLSRLLSGNKGELSHAHLDRTMLSTLPSTTMATWVTAFTGATPAEHGVTGNEFFIREKREFVAPIPVTFSDLEVVLKNYTDDYIGDRILAPTVWERMRKLDPNVQIWVAMMFFYRGADKLLKTDRGVLVDAMRSFVHEQLEEGLNDERSLATYESLDEETTEAVVEELEDEDEPTPDVLTVYYSGADQYAHVAKKGPTPARREYLTKALEPEFEKLREALTARRALDDRWVVVTSDHGHTQVIEDERHALGTDDQHDPPALLEKAGFRVRPFKLEVDDDADFQSVLAYQGAIAYVYLADRSTCAKPGQACDWKRPPRFREDVLAAADAFYSASRDGTHVRKLKGTLDMVLARQPRPAKQKDLPFQVYVGGGKLEPIASYLARHPHPDYVAFEERMADLAVGPVGERAGDVLLIANNGNVKSPKERFYFSAEYSSWHGSPSRQDSEIPLIVAHPRKSRAEIARSVRQVLGPEGRQQEIAELLIALRYGSGEARRGGAAR
jgi:predicted AlkP superfamily pyrophosphatase or phosphodiesterase